MTADATRVEGLFRRSDGSFRFARWRAGLAPVVFGASDVEGKAFEAAVPAVAGLAGGLDPAARDLDANLLVFLVDDWTGLNATPGLDRLIPDLAKLVSVLAGAGANQYRIFAFEPGGAIRLCVVLLRRDADLAAAPPRVLAVSQVAQSMLLWSDAAFAAESPVARLPGSDRALVAPFFADLVRAAYAADIPDASDDPAVAARIAEGMAAIGPSRP